MAVVIDVASTRSVRSTDPAVRSLYLNRTEKVFMKASYQRPIEIFAGAREIRADFALTGNLRCSVFRAAEPEIGEIPSAERVGDSEPSR